MSLIQLVLGLALALSATTSQSTANATISAGRIHCTSVANSVSVRTGKDKAVFTLDKFQITIDRAQVTWGKDHHLALPVGWKQVDLADDGKSVEVAVEGKAIGSIKPGD